MEPSGSGSNSSATRLLAIITFGAIICSAAFYVPPLFIAKEAPEKVDELRTGGTSAVALMVENRWRGIYRKARGVKIDYDSVGTSEGFDHLIDGSYSIAFSHGPMPEQTLKKAVDKGGPVLHIPVALCAVVPVYNLAELNGMPPLNLTGEVLAEIFMGRITRWDDSAIKSLNPSAALPDAPITVVYREDSSGTTTIFAEYLEATSPTWRQTMGPAKSAMKWPVGVAMTRSQGVAYHVYQTPGAIGYVDLVNASSLTHYGLQYAAMQNKDKTAFIHAEAPNMTAALKESVAELRDDLTFSLIHKPGKDSYPICGGIWAVCYQKQPAANGRQVVDFLRWITHEGQQYTPDMSYAPLPDELDERIEAKLKLIKSE